MIEMHDYRLDTKIDLLFLQMESFEKKLEAFEEELAKLKEQCYNIPTLTEKENEDGK